MTSSSNPDTPSAGQNGPVAGHRNSVPGAQQLLRRSENLGGRQKGSVICISDIIDISPGNLDSSLCFFQPSVSHDVLLHRS